MSGATTPHSEFSEAGAEASQPILYRLDSEKPAARGQAQQWELPQPTSQVQQVYDDEPSYTQPVPKPLPSDINEIVSLLKVRTSMLAMGACERIRKLSRAHPHEVCQSPILSEMLKILEEGPLLPLSAAVLSALATLALDPEGRQSIIIQGGATPLIKILKRCDLTRPHTAKAVQLIMNLAADGQNRRVIREAGGCEAIVGVMRVAPLDAMMEQAMGALHNVMLTDSKAKTRAVDAGVAYGLARVLAVKMDEGNTLSVRSRMLLADLLRIQDLQQRIVEAAHELQLHIPGMMPARRFTTASSGTTSEGRSSHVGELRSSHAGEKRASTLGEPAATRITTEPIPED